MLKLARGGDSSPMTAGMSAQRRRSRKGASASDSLASLATTTITTNNSAKSSSSARKTQSSKHHHHHSTPSSLERIVTDSTTTPIISAAEESAATPSFTSSNNKKSANKAKHSSKKRSSSSITSLSSLVMTPSADKQIIGTNIDDNTSSSPLKKSHKKKRQMSPRSKSKLDSLVTQQQQEEAKDDSDEKDKETPLENSQQRQKEERPIVEGSIVMVAPRTWPGMNKLGGVGRVTAIHSSTSYDLDSQQKNNDKEEGGEGGAENNSIIDASTTTTYDVSYVLGGKDKNIEAEYVSLHDTNQDAPRERQQRNISSLSMSETNDQEVATKKKSVKKKKRKRVESSLMTTSSIEASPTKTKTKVINYFDSNKTNSTSRGKRLRQLKKVKEQQMTAAAEVAEDETEMKSASLKSPAFSLSSQFSNQEESLSPLDYLAESYPKLDTTILNEYSDKWGDDDEQKDQKEVGEESEEERDDDPSSSVVSTDDEGRTFTPPKRIRRKRSSPFKYSNRGGDVMSPPTENKSLEREYGRLALKKQEIERKMKIYKSDAEKINPWAKAAVGADNGEEGRTGNPLFAQSSSRSEGLSRFRDDESSNYQARPSGDKPTREEIEFGELVYQRNLTNRRMAELKDGYPKQRSSRPKKKRRRRVVETITRVIHEESEDDASSISDRHLLLSDRGRYVHDYHGQPHHYRSRNETSSSRYLTDGRDSGSSEAYQDRDHYADDNIHEPRKRRYSEQAAASGGGNRKTKKSRSTSMLEDLD